MNAWQHLLETHTDPRELTYDNGEGFSCVCPAGDEEVKDIRDNLHGCDEKNLIDGTVAYVTGAFGLTCPSVVVNTLTASIRHAAKPAKSKFDVDPQDPTADPTADLDTNRDAGPDSGQEAP